MEEIPEAIYKKGLSSTDYRAYFDLKDYCREVLKTNVPIAVKYLLLLSYSLEEVIPQMQSILLSLLDGNLRK